MTQAWGRSAAALALALLLGASPSLALPLPHLPALPGGTAPPASPALPSNGTAAVNAVANAVAPLLPGQTGAGLAAAAAALGLKELATPLPPQPSRVLGQDVLPQGTATLYALRAASLDHPFADAAAGWNALLKVRSADALAADPDLAAAGRLPRDVQENLAVLLYALTDASALQQQALSGLTAAQLNALLRSPGQLASGQLDPTTVQGQQALAALEPAVLAVDQQRLAAAAQIVAAAADHAGPVLQEWSRAQRALPQTPNARLQDLTEFAATHRGSTLPSGAPRLQVLQDAIQMAARWQGIDISLLPARPAVSPDHPLADALRSFAASQGLPVPAATPLAQADLLPASLQTAVANILLSEVSALRASALAAASPQDLRSAWAAQAGLVRAIQENQPVLEAWGLVYGHHAWMAKTPIDAANNVRLLADAGKAAVRGSGDLTDLVKLANVLAGTGSGLDAPAAPAPGHLADAVAALYARLGIALTPGQRSAMQTAAARLPPHAEAAAAGILEAELRALARLDGLYGSMSAQDWANAERWSTLDPMRLAAVGDVAGLRAYYGLSDRVQQAYLDGALDIAAAMRTAATSFDAPVPAPAHRPWYISMWDIFGFIPTADAQTVSGEPTVAPGTVPCQPIPQVVDCANDVLFMDPLLHTIVVSGVGTTVYNATNLPQLDVPVQAQGVPNANRVAGAVHMRGQILTLDLGGNDVYANNAGGAMPGINRPTAPQPPSVSDPIANVQGVYFTDPGAVAVALDLGGQDHYLPPTELPARAIQGAGAGGIGMLWDRAGDDTYEAKDRAQGFGGGGGGDAATRSDLPCATATYSCTGGLFGVGILLDGAGNDRYTARSLAQGASDPGTAGQQGTLPGAGAGILVDLSGNDLYTLTASDPVVAGQGSGSTGLGLLVDGAGDDNYLKGDQGNGHSGLGVGALVDLDGHDHYTRKDLAGKPFGDGECHATVPLPTDDTPAGLQQYEAGLSTQLTQQGFGVTVDLDASAPGCTLVSPGFPPSIPDVGGIVQGMGKDSDGDHYPDGIETLLANPPAGSGISPVVWDPNDPHDYPVGMPRQAPPGWPSDQPYPPAAAGDNLPYGSPYLVKVPTLFVLGDGGATPYPAGDSYRAMLDLGGANTFSDGPTANLVLSAGSDRDVYEGGNGAQGGLNSLLIDMGGNDQYVAGADSQGSAGASGFFGLLFDAGGNDTYAASSGSQGSQEVGSGATLSMLLDAAGDDRFLSPQQGSAQTGLATALFLDLAGNDTYQPAGRQGVSSASATAGFLDAGGQDRYIGIGTSGPDLSPYLNGRLHVEASGASVSLFADQDPLAHTAGEQALARHTLASCAAPDPAAPAAPCTVPSPPDLPQDPAAAGDFARDSSASLLDMVDLGLHIGTVGPDTYTKNYALLLEPGGDDLYRNNAGSSLVRDLGENAASSTTPNPVAGSVPLPIPACPCDIDASPGDVLPIASVLLDEAGNDLYTVPGQGIASQDTLRDVAQLAEARPFPGILTQGAGFLGTGLLADAAGNDRYVSAGLSQGFGMVGTGILWDQQGDDAYRMDPAVVRHPLRSGASVAWQENLGGQWRILETVPVPGAGCPPPQPFQAVPEAGTMGPGYDLANGRLAYSLFDRQGGSATGGAHGGVWRLRLVAPAANGCQATAGTPIFPVVDASGAVASNQLNPRFAPGGLVWQDDRDGPSRIYATASCSKIHPVCALVPEGPAGSNQAFPDFPDGRRLVWQDDRAGPWHVYYEDLQGEGAVDLSAGLPGASIHPRIAGDLAAWLVQSADGQPWHVAVHSFQTGQTRLLTGTSALVDDPAGVAISGSKVLFTDTGDGTRVLAYDWSDGPTGTLSVFRPQALGLAVDPAAAQATWVSTVTRPVGPSLDGDPFWQAEKGPLSLPASSGAAPVSSTQSRNEHRNVQGSAWLASLGVVLDQSGQDTYQASASSQGSSFSTFTPKQSFRPGDPTPGSTYLGGQGVLADLQGNDAYQADRFSQGAHVGELSDFVRTPPAQQQPPQSVAYAEATQATGLLIDASGSDVYAASRAAQGYSELVAGVAAASVYERPPSPPSPKQGPEAYADESAGALVDLGGTDRYVYPPGVGALATVSPQAACPALPVTPPVLLPLGCLAGNAPAAGATTDGRNGQVWRQTSRSPQAGAGNTSSDPFDDPSTLPDRTPLDCLPNTGYSCAPILHIGGLGVDLPLMDQEEGAARNALDGMFSVTLAPLPASVQDRVGLSAQVKPTGANPGFDIKRTEFFVGGTFLDYGQYDAHCDCYQVSWDTAAFPDGIYAVAVHAFVGPQGGLALGYASSADRQVKVDNLVQVLDFTPLNPVFSPHPFAYDAHAPAEVAFRLTKNAASDTSDPSAAYASVTVVPEGQAAPVRTLLADSAVSSVDVAWDGRDGAGNLLPSGDYTIVARAWDHPGIPARVVERDFQVRMLADAPGASCLRLASAPDPCNPLLFLNTLNTNQPGHDQVRLHVDPATPLAGGLFRVLVRPVLDGVPQGDWTVAASDASPDADLPAVDGKAMDAVALVQDEAGNLESVAGCGAGVAHQSDAGDVACLQQAATAKFLANTLASRSFARLQADLRAPQVSAGDQVFHALGRYATLDDLMQLGPGADLQVAYGITKSGAVGIKDAACTSHVPAQECPPANGTLDWAFFGPDQAHGAPPAMRTEPATVHILAEANATATSSYQAEMQATWMDWPALVAQVAPGQEGRLQVTLRATDVAGNPDSSDGLRAFFILDRTPPTLLESAVDYIGAPGEPAGHQARPQDHIGVRLKAVDPDVGDFTPPASGLAITLDASAITTAPGAAALAFRYDPNVGEYTLANDAFLFNPPAGLDLANPPALPLTLVDAAGNVRIEHLAVNLGDPHLGLTLDSKNVGADHADLEFHTLRAATLDFRLGSDCTAPATQSLPAGTVHIVHLENLEPGSSLAYCVVATVAGGTADQALKGTFTLLSGLDLGFDGPAPDSHAGGVLPIRLHASVAAHPDLPQRVVVKLRHEATGAEDTVGDADTIDGRFELGLVTDGLPDGPYSLVAQMSYGGESVTRTVTGLVLDNTAPKVDILQPAPDALLGAAPASLIVRVHDALSAPDPASLTLFRNGTEPLGLGAAVATPVDSHTVLLALPLAGLPQGASRLTVAAADSVGNLGSASLRVLMDRTAPNATLDRVVYPGQQSAARPGQVVRFEVAADDAAGVRRAAADSAGLGLLGVGLHREGALWALEAVVPAGLKDGVYPVQVLLEDRVGNRALANLFVAVDGTPPTLSGLQLLPLAADRALLLANATGALHVSAEAGTPRGGTLTARPPTDDEAAQARALPGANLTGRSLLVLEGLEPGATYAVRAEARDAAANTAAAQASLRFLPVIVAPPPLGGLRAEPAPGGGVSLSWKAPAGVPQAGYQVAVLRSVGDAPFAEIGRTWTDPYVDAPAEPGVRLRYTVQAVNLLNTRGPLSEPVSLLSPVPLQIAAAQVSPRQGVAFDTLFTFTATVRGAGAAQPEVWLILGPTAYPMQLAAGADCRTTCTATRAMRLPALDLEHPDLPFHVEVLDGGGVHRFPAHGEQDGPVVFASPSDLHRTSPLAVAPLLLLGLLLAAGRRRRR